MSKIRKIAIRIIKWTFALLLGLILLLILLGAIFQERVVNWIIADLQTQLALPVRIEKIKFSFIENFPNASAVLENSTVLYPGFQNTDTLLSVKRFYINLNLIDLIRGKISVRGIDINNATITLIAQADGKLPNIHLFKKTADSVSSAFKIRLIEIKNVEILYTNKAANDFQQLSIKDASFAGTVTDQGLMGGLKINVRKLKTNNFRNFDALSEQAAIEVKGYYIYGNSLSLENIKYKSEYISISGMYSVKLSERLNGKCHFSVLLPNEKFLNKFLFQNKEIEIKSHSKATIDLTGSIIGPQAWDIDFEAIAKIDDAKVIVLRDVPIEIIDSKIKIKASLQNKILLPKEIIVEPTTFLHEDKTITLSLSYLPKNHLLSAKISGNISPTVFSKVLKISSPTITGDNINIDATFFSTEFSITNFNPDNLKVLGTVEISKLNIESPDLNFSNISGSLGISDSLVFKHLSLDGSLGKLDLSGTIPHWRQSFFAANNRLPLEIKGNLSSPDLNLNLPQWGLSEESSTTKVKVDSAETPLIISKIEINFVAKKIALRQLRGSDAHGTLIYLPTKSFSLNNVSLITLGGKTLFNLENQLINNENTVSFNGKVYGIYVDSLFHTFNNFDQTFISSQHLSGRIDGDINLKGVLENGKLLNNKLFCLSTIEITDGCLKNYEPLKKLSGFINLKELETIRFRKLKNTIHIENNEIVIPEMLIENNALNINVSGVHKLSGSFDYRMRIKLMDLLWSRKKKANQFRSDLGIVEQEEPNGGSLFIKLTGTPENYSFSYDKARAIETMGKRLKQEGTALRNIFKQRNAISNQKVESKKNSGFVISDPLENKEKIVPVDTTKQKPLKKNSGFKIDWE
ncbi:AsmA-like C-terminal region-containing protein [Williamwhitmania taraxaci]|uniref:AsmA-like C-terminal region n=1 Tax=Williamwhitmania taraxaci TaxID=1640674 RepID=A0A1G6GYA9_9BACT|nr:AsmA-like C-terminal region-containing protein [Williamwhitmania taraxaci]SDB86924.1 AsmA-like C-terminal region [Williamwhitmania taraxaci]